VTSTLKLALAASGCDQVTVVHKPRLLSDNGSSYVAGNLAEFLEDKGMDHGRGAPQHPQAQGKIEYWHQTKKNCVLLGTDYLPGDLERQIEAFVEHYTHRRHHESLGNVTPADACIGRASAILKEEGRYQPSQTLPTVTVSGGPFPDVRHCDRRRRVSWPWARFLRPGGPAIGHVPELEARDPQAMRCEPLSNESHEFGIHSRSGVMGQQNRYLRVTIEQKSHP